LGQELDNLGQVWTLRDAAFKLFPCCHYIHPFLEGVQQLKLQNIALENIKSIECKVPQGAAAIICEPWNRKQTPSILNEAKYSLPYCMALAFLDIPITAQHFLSDTVNAEAVAFGQKISWSHMLDADFPAKFQAEILVHLKDGQTSSIRIDQVKGSADRPASIEEIEAKFKTNTSVRFTASTQNSIINLMRQGDSDFPVAMLSELLGSR
jgi:2-methylcitrate dehydratase PrpD